MAPSSSGAPTSHPVATVCGPVSADALGIVDGHEHLAAHATPELVARDEDLALTDPARVLPDLHAFRRSGGATVIDWTTVDYGRDIPMLRWLSQHSGVNVIAMTGFNKGDYCRPCCEGRDPRALAVAFVAEIEDGVGEHRVRPAAVKFGTSRERMLPWEAVAAEAAAHTHTATGCLVTSHTEAGTHASEQLDFLARHGVPADRVLLAHLDRNPDLELHLRLIDRGAYLGYDQIPKPKYATEARALELIVALAQRGLHGHIIVGGDFARRSLYRGWGGEPGLEYLQTTFRAALAQRLDAAGLAAEPVLAAVFGGNAARALSGRSAR